ncbi:hypothetical protein AAKU55_003429 [Oxalobacteraceae bacterium GrIS 1.11]
MNDILQVSIEICIEASSEIAAQRYALAWGIDMRHCKWNRDRNGEGGRLYASEIQTTPAGHALPTGAICGAIPAIERGATTLQRRNQNR